MLGQALKFRKCARTYCIRTPLKCNKGVGKHFQRVPVECNTLPNHGCHGIVHVTACVCDQMCATVSILDFALALVNNRHALRDVATAW